jgi:hypothetical protein
MPVNPNKQMTARERQREAIRRLVVDRDVPTRTPRPPRGNQEADTRDVERGLEKLGRVIGH